MLLGQITAQVYNNVFYKTKTITVLTTYLKNEQLLHAGQYY